MSGIEVVGRYCEPGGNYFGINVCKNAQNGGKFKTKFNETHSARYKVTIEYNCVDLDEC